MGVITTAEEPSRQRAEVRYLVETSALARMSYHMGVRSPLASPLMLGVIAQVSGQPTRWVVERETL